MAKVAVFVTRLPQAEGMIFKNRVSDDVGDVNFFLSALIRALRRVRHFALVE